MTPQRYSLVVDPPYLPHMDLHPYGRWVLLEDMEEIVDAERARHAALVEKARLVSQWHGSLMSGPMEVLDAELGELGDMARAALDGEPQR